MDLERHKKLIWKRAKDAWKGNRKFRILGYEMEDIAQEISLQLIKRLKTYDPLKSSESTFIYMNVNQILHNLTQKMNNVSYSDKLDRIPQVIGDEEPYSKEELKKFEEFRNSMPPKRREVLDKYLSGKLGTTDKERNLLYHIRASLGLVPQGSDEG